MCQFYVLKYILSTFSMLFITAGIARELIKPYLRDSDRQHCLNKSLYRIKTFINCIMHNADCISPRHCYVLRALVIGPVWQFFDRLYFDRPVRMCMLLLLPTSYHRLEKNKQDQDEKCSDNVYCIII